MQRLEQKIALAAKNRITPQQKTESEIAELLQETDYTLCFSHLFPQSYQIFTNAPGLSEPIKQKLLSKGITQIYEYQEQAFTTILAQKSVVITAPTGNGKTESFLVPVLQKILEWKKQGLQGIKVLIFYPTKALASDQYAKILYYAKDIHIFPVQLDSDVDQKERDAIYQNKELDMLITTPDLIHYSLHKNEFRDFIAATKIVVFDEIHTYTGTFGTHVYYFLQRLEQAVKEGKNIQYIAASATIANPVEFTSK